MFAKTTKLIQMIGGSGVRLLLGIGLILNNEKLDALKIVSDSIARCTLCEELSSYRTENKYLTVPGNGNANANIMIIGEGPGKG